MTIKRMSQTSLKAVGNHRKMMAGSAPFSDMELVVTTVLSAAVPSVTFAANADWSQYKHLQIRAVIRTDRGAVEDGNIQLRLNSDSGTSYRSHYLVGTGSSVVSYDNGANLGIGSHAAASAGAGQFTAQMFDILDFNSTSKNKTVKMFAGHSGSFNSARLASGVWLNNAAVTNITFAALSANFVVGTRFSVYGIRG